MQINVNETLSLNGNTVVLRYNAVPLSLPRCLADFFFVCVCATLHAFIFFTAHSVLHPEGGMLRETRCTQQEET